MWKLADELQHFVDAAYMMQRAQGWHELREIPPKSAQEACKVETADPQSLNLAETTEVVQINFEGLGNEAFPNSPRFPAIERYLCISHGPSGLAVPSPRFYPPAHEWGSFPRRQPDPPVDLSNDREQCLVGQRTNLERFYVLVKGV